MFRFNILDMSAFLKAVNECSGTVNMIQENGYKRNINKEWGVQSTLKERFRENHNSLNLTLSIPDSKDYLRIVNCLIS